MKAAGVNQLAFIGFGEVAATLYSSVFRDVEGLIVSVSHFEDRELSDATTRRLRTSGLYASPADQTLRDADIVISAVTPASALEVAQHAADYLQPGSLYVDVNSISGPTMRELGATIQQCGARCVDAAIMGPVPLMKDRVPILLSGQYAPDFDQISKSFGLNTSVLSMQVGDASSLKMLWSVITKGSIALFAESLTAAHRLDLLNPLRELLAQEFGNMGTDAMVLRLLRSTVQSGARRLDEMNEASATLQSVSVPTWSASATSLWIRELSRMAQPTDSTNVTEVVESISEELGSIRPNTTSRAEESSSD